MIYKFECIENDDSTMEVELHSDEVTTNMNFVEISIKNSDDDEWRLIHLSKKNVYNLIGALHQLHKEM